MYFHSDIEEVVTLLTAVPSPSGGLYLIQQTPKNRLRAEQPKHCGDACASLDLLTRLSP